MKNNKGFTLIELLATITLLAVLMLIAVPNVIGVVNRNKNNTYVEDAKKLVALAEYKIRANSGYKPPTGQSYCFTMNSLGNADFNTTAPNGGKYLSDKSYVRAKRNTDGSIAYSVVLVENKALDAETNNSNGAQIEYIGVGVTQEISRDDLYKDDISGIIKSTTNSGSISQCNGTSK
ncbi:MAG: type II secretion system protein [Bacilli bacterium]|nr:type II secretion system protein [Bacilli bacterium]